MAVNVADLVVTLRADSAPLQTELAAASASATQFQNSVQRISTVSREAGVALDEGLVAGGLKAERGLMRMDFALGRMVQSGNLTIGSLSGMARGMSMLAPAIFPVVGILTTLVLTVEHVKKAFEEQQVAADNAAEHFRTAVNKMRDAASVHSQLARQNAAATLLQAKANLDAAQAQVTLLGVSGRIGGGTLAEAEQQRQVARERLEAMQAEYQATLTIVAALRQGAAAGEAVKNEVLHRITVTEAAYDKAQADFLARLDAQVAATQVAEDKKFAILRQKETDIEAVNLKLLHAFKDAAAALEKPILDVSSALTRTFEQFSKSVGAGKIKDFFSGFLAIIGDAMQQFGKALIAWGVGLLGWKTALQSLDPVPAIAAGIALVALGAALSSAATGPASMGGGSGGASASATASAAAQGTTTINFPAAGFINTGDPIVQDWIVRILNAAQGRNVIVNRG